MSDNLSDFCPKIDFSSPFRDDELASPQFPYLRFLDGANLPQRVYLVVDYKRQTLVVDWDRELKSTEDELTNQALTHKHFFYHPMKMVISPYMTKEQLTNAYENCGLRSLWSWESYFDFTGEYLDNGFEELNWWLYDSYRDVYRTCDRFEEWLNKHHIGKESYHR